MNFSVALKLHLLLAHETCMILRRKGFARVGESVIESVHQFQQRYIDSTKRLLDDEKVKDLKSKRQAIRNDMTVERAMDKLNESIKHKKNEIVIEKKT